MSLDLKVLTYKQCLISSVEIISSNPTGGNILLLESFVVMYDKPQLVKPPEGLKIYLLLERELDCFGKITDLLSFRSLLNLYSLPLVKTKSWGK